jgi:tetratricopeptide (TPR) repeat protein
MQKSAVYLCLLTTLGALAAPVIPSSAQKYLDVLQKRPQPDAVFERFYTAWLEEGTAAGLLEYLSAQASGARAAATDHLILALFHSHRGYDREALAAYDAALKLDAKNAGAWLERARIEARLLDFPVALTSVEQAAAAQPSDSLALDIARFKGRLLLRLDRNDEALALWRDIVQKNAGNEDLIEEVIDWFAEEAQYEAAIETSQALVKRTRDPLARTLRQLRLADVLLQAERRDESLAMLDTVFAATGAETWIEADVLGRIERVFRMTDDVAGLERHLAELTSAHPQRVTLAWQHAQLLAGTGHSAEALSSAKALLHANPGRRDLQDQFLDLLDSLNPAKPSRRPRLSRARIPRTKSCSSGWLCCSSARATSPQHPPRLRPTLPRQERMKPHC